MRPPPLQLLLLQDSWCTEVKLRLEAETCSAIQYELQGSIGNHWELLGITRSYWEPLGTTGNQCVSARVSWTKMQHREWVGNRLLAMEVSQAGAADRERFKIKKLKKKLTNVSFAFTHTYTPVKTNIFRFFPQSYMENFEKCAKTQKQKNNMLSHVTCGC